MKENKKRKHDGEKTIDKIRPWRVTPFNGLDVVAPRIYVDAKTSEEALKLAKEKTNLSNYPNWGFRAICIGK